MNEQIIASFKNIQGNKNDSQYWIEKFIWSCQIGDFELAQIIFYHQFPEFDLINKIFSSYNFIIEKAIQSTIRNFNEGDHLKIVKWIFEMLQDNDAEDIYESLFSGIIEECCQFDKLNLIIWLQSKNVRIPIKECLLTSIRNNKVDIFNYFCQNFVINDIHIINCLHYLFFDKKEFEEIVEIVYNSLLNSSSNSLNMEYIDIINSYPFDHSIKYHDQLNDISNEFRLLLNHQITLNRISFIKWYYKIGINLEYMYDLIWNNIEKQTESFNYSFEEKKIIPHFLIDLGMKPPLYSIYFNYYQERELRKIWAKRNIRIFQRIIKQYILRPDSNLVINKGIEFEKKAILNNISNS